MSMRKLRRHRNKKQVRFAVALIVFLLTIMTVGYAAFSTNITLNARGNILYSASFPTSDLKQAENIVTSGE